jgi:hypothetical protein
LVQYEPRRDPTHGLQHVAHAGTNFQLTRLDPVVPPKVEYKLTELGLTLGAAFCGVWIWAAENLKQVEQARRDFDEKARV